MRKKTKLVHGFGTNDADYSVVLYSGIKKITCPFYRVWSHMLQRCYCEKFQSKQRTYIGCSVDPEWLIFSNFKSWMEAQDWKGKELDKDILKIGNRVYCREYCVFVDSMTNTFTIDRAADRGEWPLGVCFVSEKSKFSAQCSNPFTKKRGHIGYFNCPNEAHEAWRKRKHELACQLADLQTDDRVANALRLRYAYVH